MFPKYFSAGISILLIAPLLTIGKMQFRQPSFLVSIVLCTLILHVAIINPVPAQFSVLIAVNITLAILIYEARFIYKKEFEIAAACLLIVNAFAIVIQSALFYLVTHTIVDLHGIIFGSASRVTEDYLNIARFSGIHVEPGTYANYISCMLAIYVFSSDFSKKAVWVSLASVFSILLTHSASVIFFVSVLLLLLGWLWRDRIGLLQVLMVLIAIIIYVYASNFITHLQSRFFQGDDGSLSLKVLGINTYLQTGLEEKLIGVGFGRDPCTACHYQDVGVILNLLSRGGIILALSFSLIFFRSLRLHGIVLSLLLFSIPVYCIMSFYETPIWLYILFSTTSVKLLDKRKKEFQRQVPIIYPRADQIFAGRGAPSAATFPDTILK